MHAQMDLDGTSAADTAFENATGCGEWECGHTPTLKPSDAYETGEAGTSVGVDVGSSVGTGVSVGAVVGSTGGDATCSAVGDAAGVASLMKPKAWIWLPGLTKSANCGVPAPTITTPTAT